MLSYEIRKAIPTVIRGGRIEGKTDTLTAARNFLCTGFGTSTKIEKDFRRQYAVKKEQVSALAGYARENDLWLTDLPQSSLYLTKGGEAEIYFNPVHQSVIKLNDAVYYPTWLHFLNSVFIHNILFEDTSYSLLGFAKRNESIVAVLQQLFIVSDSPTDLEVVKEFLLYNGFENTRMNDCYSKELD